jgi:hypothetical protein
MATKRDQPQELWGLPLQDDLTHLNPGYLTVLKAVQDRTQKEGKVGEEAIRVLEKIEKDVLLQATLRKRYVSAYTRICLIVEVYEEMAVNDQHNWESICLCIDGWWFDADDRLMPAVGDGDKTEFLKVFYEICEVNEVEKCGRRVPLVKGFASVSENNFIYS